MVKVIPIPNIDGYVMTINGKIISTTTFKCSMELHLSESDTWIGVNELDVDGCVVAEYVWYFSPEAIHMVLFGQ